MSSKTLEYIKDKGTSISLYTAFENRWFCFIQDFRNDIKAKRSWYMIWGIGRYLVKEYLWEIRNWFLHTLLVSYIRIYITHYGIFQLYRFKYGSFVYYPEAILFCTTVIIIMLWEIKTLLHMCAIWNCKKMSLCKY